MEGHDRLVEDHWWYPDDYPGEVATIADFHDDMLGNSTEDPFQLVWEGDTTGQPALTRLRSSPPRAMAPTVRHPDPAPSEDAMAAWLYPIVSGVDHADDCSKVPFSEANILEMDQDTFGAKNTGTRSDSSEKRKSASGGLSRTRSSHHSGTHNSTERRRRCKISDRLRTLQQLVPGCDKSNQASTLDQTIQYMKSLQQKVQSGSAAGAMYPVVQPPLTAAVTMPISATAMGQVMMPYGAMFPYAHYHTMMMPAAAPSAMPVMMPAPTTFAAPEGQCAVSMEQQRHKEKGKRIL